MTKEEFTERTGIKSDVVFEEANRMYMAAGDMDKDAFCMDYKEHGNSILLAYFYHHSNMLETQKKDLDAFKLDMVKWLLKQADETDDSALREKAVELVGEQKVITLKIELGCELWKEDTDYIYINLQ